VSKNDSDPIRLIFESASKIVEQKRKWSRTGYQCNPCDPLLPLKHPNTFVEGKIPNREKDSQIGYLIAHIMEYIQQPDSKDLIFLKGPKGSGKSIFAHIFEQYSQLVGLSSTYQDGYEILVTNVDQFKLKEDLIFLDNAIHLKNILKSILNSSSSSNSPKIIAIMDSTEFEIYRRHCLQTGDRSYQNFFSMPSYNEFDISDILIKRLVMCSNENIIPPKLLNITKEIAKVSFGNPGIAIGLLDEILKFPGNLDDLYLSFGINLKVLEDFSSSKTQILREILIREIENEFLPSEEQNYIIHKELTNLLQKTKSTITHHLSDLLSSNLIYIDLEQSTTRDRREKAYRPNDAIFGILEYLAFESSAVDTHITVDGTYHEK
jgi:DNA-binding transcriptional ArsR family regulator